MKSLFPGYYQPTNDEAAELWQDCLFVLDANVLLNLYRYSPATRERLLEILGDVSDRLWIPHQAAKEYHANRINVISQQSDAYTDIKDFLHKSRGQIEAKLNSYRRHPYIDVVKIQSRINTAYDKVCKELRASKNDHPDLLRDDSIRDNLTRLLEGKVGTPVGVDTLKGIYKEGEERFKLSVPPGYMDAKNKEGDQKYGDVVLWFQIIEKARSDGKPVIFVTDDTKEDWWYKFRGMIVGPNPLLTDEFQQKVGLAFYMYRSDQFMEHAQNFLKQRVDKDAIQEVRYIRELDEMVQRHRSEIEADMEETRANGAALNIQLAEIGVEMDEFERNGDSLTDEQKIQHMRKMSDIHLRVDSLIATREEMRRRFIHLVKERDNLSAQQELIKKIAKSEAPGF